VIFESRLTQQSILLLALELLLPEPLQRSQQLLPSLLLFLLRLLLLLLLLFLLLLLLPLALLLLLLLPLLLLDLLWLLLRLLGLLLLLWQLGQRHGSAWLRLMLGALRPFLRRFLGCRRA
jgi:hypothetical protein